MVHAAAEKSIGALGNVSQLRLLVETSACAMHLIELTCLGLCKLGRGPRSHQTGAVCGAIITMKAEMCRRDAQHTLYTHNTHE